MQCLVEDDFGREIWRFGEKTLFLHAKICNFGLNCENMDALLQMRQQQISTTDAIWALIVSQSKSIQKTLAKRLEAHLAEEKRLAQEKYVRDTLTCAMKEVREAEAEGRELPDARLLFEHMDGYCLEGQG